MRRLGLLLSFLPALALAGPWKPAEFPNPKRDLDLCGRGGVASNICDPDLVLSDQASVCRVCRAYLLGTSQSCIPCVYHCCLEATSITRARRSPHFCLGSRS